MYQVLKRDGKVAEFDLQKISDAIKLAFEAQEKQFHPNVIDLLGKGDVQRLLAVAVPKKSA